jgi:hypothetical protein
MEGLVYLLSSLTAAACSALLLRGWRRSPEARLLLWSGVCFALLTASNLLLYADKVLLPSVDLSLPRELASLAGALVLICGLILDGE